MVGEALARSERFELPTLGIEIRCSIQLSYERTHDSMAWSGAVIPASTALKRGPNDVRQHPNIRTAGTDLPGSRPPFEPLGACGGPPPAFMRQSALGLDSAVGR